MTKADNSRGGINSGISRRRAILERAERADLVETTVDALGQEGIGRKLLEQAVKLVNAAASGEIPVPDTPQERKQLADAAKVVHYMARLQLGESTQNVAHATVADREAKAQELQQRLDAVRMQQDNPT